VALAEAEAEAAPPDEHLELAREAAVQSIVLLRNERDVLPLDAGKIHRLAVVGPLADEPQEQLGTWVFDGDASLSHTPLEALHEHLSEAGSGAEIRYVRGLETSRSDDHSALDEVRQVAAWADATLLFVGEEAVLSGEAHSRADLTLPGAQNELIRAAREASQGPVVVVLLAGRPLALESIIDATDALLCAWHPGTMAGPAIADLLFGVETPSGRLVMTFPRVTGQVPIYYAHRNTGRPPTPDTYVHMRDLPRGASQLSTGNTSYHLDTHYTPLFNFGFGLSYTRFEYADVRADGDELPLDGSITLSAEVRNVGPRRGIEVVQLYTHDVVASVTRPVRELKGFERIELEPGEARRVEFTLTASDLAFPGRDQRWVTEPGPIAFGIGGDSTVPLSGRFTIVER
jgi:beta-glucosidase